MTTITIPRALLEQALEELEKTIVRTEVRQTTINNLRAALAQEQEPAPIPPLPPVHQWQRGCVMCGIGNDGRAYGYVCSRSDCPTKVTCGGAV